MASYLLSMHFCLRWSVYSEFNLGLVFNPERNSSAVSLSMPMDFNTLCAAYAQAFCSYKYILS